MSKKRGLSADEKKIRMLEIFHQSKDFYQLKELEKIAPKEKGITMQSVKEVVQSLVDDHLVDSEKIGTSIYFWSFPSKAKNAKKRKFLNTQDEFEEISKKLKKTEEAIILESADRETSEERNVLLKLLDEVTKRESELKKELQKYRDSDPEYIAQLKIEVEELKTAANRWTENIYILKSYIKNNFQIDNDIIDQNFNIPADLDYIEN
ncbi:meiotic nuclear division protein 1 homolog [Melitaea cinxia]|uniref:meiotic nuclear division protein 1 homolog n=1 Tax=Melitaea cinxia TaxID=113334 RepID=UPI001E26FD9C|nr:meiotic nuclear division protein 1 homolog [Melitaea cinxia]